MKAIFLITLLGALSGLQAQAYQSRIYRSYLEGRMDQWKRVIEQMEAEYRISKSTTLLFDITEAQYGYVAYCLSTKRKKEARVELDKAMKQIDHLLEEKGPDPRLFCLRGAFYGFMIRFEPLKVKKYGTLSQESNDRALELDPGEPQAWMEKANIAFYKPAFVGGSKKEAVGLYKKAVSLYEASPGDLEHNWLYLNCLVGLAMAYEETDQLKAAREVYERLLRKEPTFQWVRDDLYPGLLEKLAAN
jgi:tetratricopeptide (TPR) repeat protein